MRSTLQGGMSTNYDYVQIGTQKWMTKNLDVTRYRNGELVTLIEDQATWNAGAPDGAWCYYNNNLEFGAIYGKMYNWYAVNDPRGLAPEGWHIPSDSEWDVLINYLGGWQYGGKLKETENNYWNPPNTGATNSSGFNALPGGYRSAGSGFNEIGDIVYYWTSTIAYGSNAVSKYMTYNSNFILNASLSFNFGNYVRCIKD